ncbi:hypothetical protein [Pedobacter nyackensis]|uniref:hypothetical protein n=1 Tax=Pedobacter nyackensis TaxID=475255 RepID=UPI00292CF852|nr:hypothetical protein [Pedobacter nyackensis]
MSREIEFKKVRDFGEIINDTFLFIRQNVKPLLSVFFYLCGFFILAGTVASIMHEMSMQNAPELQSGPFSSRNFSDILNWNYFVVVFISLGSYAAITVSVLSFIALYIQKGKVAPSVEEVWAYFKYYYFRTFFSSIAVGIFICIAFVCCIFPGFYVWPAMCLFYPIMILENANFDYSFSRSFKLLKDRWWTTAAVILVIYVITYSCMMIPVIPGLLFTMMGTFFPEAKEWNILGIVIGAILANFTYVFMIIPVVGITLCYFNLVEVQESAGLMDRINQFGEEKNEKTGLEEY